MPDIRSDVTEHEPESWPDADVFHCGFPCQPFSMAGQRLGVKDVRGQLIYFIMKLIACKLFKVVLLENVRGLLQAKFRPLLDWILAEFRRLGYIVDYEMMNARFHGVPQNRERVFIAAVRADVATTTTFAWPSELQPVSLRSVLDPLTTEERSKNLNKLRPPASQTVATRNVNEAYREMRANGLSPAEIPMVVDVDSVNCHMMFDCSPCLTRTRAQAGGHWITCRGRRMSSNEMERLMGIGMVSGPVRVPLTRPAHLTDREWHGLLGNAIPVPLLARVLPFLLRMGGLVSSSFKDPFTP